MPVFKFSYLETNVLTLTEAKSTRSPVKNIPYKYKRRQMFHVYVGANSEHEAKDIISKATSLETDTDPVRADIISGG